MTISTSTVRVSYAGNGSTTAFAVPFQFFTADEVEVWALTAGVFTRMTRGTHYTVTGGLGETGTITAVTAPAVGTTWSFRRATLRIQAVNYTNNDPFDGDTTEGALDRLVALIQEVDDGNGRSLRLPVGEATIAALPAAAARANMNLTFDSTGAPTASLPVASAVAVASAMQPVVGAGTLILARSLMGGPRMVNVITDFGATGGGSVDDRAAIQAAINSLSAGTVYLPPGIYLVGSDITMKPAVQIVADDPLAATLLAGANNVKLLKYAAASTQNGFTVRRVGFSAGAYSGVRAVSLDGTDSAKRCVLVTLEDLYVSLGARGIDLRFCADTIITGCRTNGTAIGNYIDQCADTEINGGWSQNGSDYGLYCSGGPGAFDEGLRATSFSTNGQAKGFGVSGQDWGQLTGCSFTTCSGGAAVFATATNWKVSNCDFAVAGGTPAAPGVLIDANCEGIQLLGNRITLNTFGISALGLRHIIKDNELTANSNVDINLTATKCIVSGNICDSTGVSTSIVEQATSDYNNIYGNNTNGTITIVGGNTKVNGDNIAY